MSAFQLPEFQSDAVYTQTQPPHPHWVPGQKQPFKEGEDIDTAQKNIVTIPASSTDYRTRYVLLVNCVIPRPMACVSTVTAEGLPNVAPFSFFNVATADPPVLMISVNRPGKDTKDTATNILRDKEFVVSLIGEWFTEAANYTSINSPATVSEFELTGLTPVPSQFVKPPRVGESAVSMECKLIHHYPLQNDKGDVTTDVMFGQILAWHIRKEVLNSDNTINVAALQPVSRLGGTIYGRTVSSYDLPRTRWEQEKSKFSKEG